MVTVALKTGGTTTRCGVCEIVPSCKNPQKTVFAFRFLKKQECGLPGTACAVTPAGLAQYTAQQGTAAAAGPVGAFTVGGTAARLLSRQRQASWEDCLTPCQTLDEPEPRAKPSMGTGFG